MSEKEFDDMKTDEQTLDDLSDPARLLKQRKRLIETGHEPSEASILREKEREEN